MERDLTPKKMPQHSRTPQFKRLQHIKQNGEPGLTNPTNANPGSFTANYLPIKKALRQQN